MDTLEKGLLKIKRADIEESVTKTLGDKRQHPEKLYEHYWDEVSALIHAFIAYDNYDPGAYQIKAVRSKGSFFRGGPITRR